MKTIFMSIALAGLFSSAIWALGSSDAPPVAVVPKATRNQMSTCGLKVNAGSRQIAGDATWPRRNFLPA